MYLLTICFVGMIFSQKALINFKYILQLISHPDCSKPFTTFYSFVIPTINPPIYPPSAAGSSWQLFWLLLDLFLFSSPPFLCRTGCTCFVWSGWLSLLLFHTAVLWLFCTIFAFSSWQIISQIPSYSFRSSSF